MFVTVRITVCVHICIDVRVSIGVGIRIVLSEAEGREQSDKNRKTEWREKDDPFRAQEVCHDNAPTLIVTHKPLFSCAVKRTKPG
jgi:hypothetical protein